MTVAPASADPGDPRGDPDRSVVSAVAQDKMGVPGSTYAALQTIQKDLEGLDSFNHLEWDESAKQLKVHYHGASKEVSDLVSRALAPNEFALSEDKFSSKVLQREAKRITTDHRTIGGAVVTSAGPTADSDRIVIKVQRDNQQKSAQPPQLSDISHFPLSIEEGRVAEPASRQYDPVSPHWGGAVMSRPTNDPNFFNICTTGFGVGYMSGSTVMTRNLTADHCGPTNAVWRTGISSTTPILGGFMDTNNGGSDLKLISPLAGTTTKFGPVIYHGDENSNAGLGIAGAVQPILNDYWCYSGSQSGMICNNKVTQLNQSICYGLFRPCYSQQTVSVQQDGISAAGNGDSGGPVIAARNGYAYAVGIISGIYNGGDNCQGKPATDKRKCSAEVITSPVQAFFNANPTYGILTYAG